MNINNVYFNYEESEENDNIIIVHQIKSNEKGKGNVSKALDIFFEKFKGKRIELFAMNFGGGVDVDRWANFLEKKGFINDDKEYIDANNYGYFMHKNIK